MAKTFSGAAGSNTSIYLDPGGVTLTLSFTIVAVFKVNTNSTSEASAIAQGGIRTGIFINTSGVITPRHYSTAYSTGSALSATSSDGYLLVAMTFGGTTAPITVRRYSYSADSWSSSDTGNVSPTTSSTDFVVLANSRSNNTALIGDVAAAAIYSRALNADQLEAFPHDLQAWVAQAPLGMWVLDQADNTQKVLDWTGGGANENSRGANIAISTTSVPGLSYGHPVLVNTVGGAGGGGAGGATPGGLAVQTAVGAPSTSLNLTTAPSGLAVLAALGMPSTAVLSAAPNGIAVPAALGTPSTSLNLTAAPSGIAVSASAGTPTAAVGLSTAPSGVNAPAALGTPATAISGTVPVGLAVPVSLGQPSGPGITLTPTGIAVPVALGTPTVATGLSAAPNGLGILSSMGAPSTTLNLSVSPAGISVAAAVGSASVSLTGAAPSGLQITASIGSPSSSAWTVTPNGIQVIVALGSPSPTFPPTTSSPTAVLSTESRAKALTSTTNSRYRTIMTE